MEIEKVCLPGDIVSCSFEGESGERNIEDGVGMITLDGNKLEGIASLGPGLKRVSGEKVVATNCGILRHKAPNYHWIETHSRRYLPVAEDKVVGVVAQKLTEGWKIDIGSADTAYLPSLAFEGVTKRNRPTFREGAVVYCRVKVAIKDMDPEVVCFDAEEKSRGMGQLPDDGYVFQVPLDVARKILHPEFKLLELLGKQFRFEITCGINGRIWLKSGSTKVTIGISRAISNCLAYTNNQLGDLVQQTINYVQGF